MDFLSGREALQREDRENSPAAGTGRRSLSKVTDHLNEDGRQAAPQWPHSGTLAPEVLEGLYDINRRYLNVLVLDAPCPSQDEGALTEAPTVSTLQPPVRAALARSPFALFNARFHDSAFWTAQLADS